ncbi:MAG: class II fructose-1,6-bisphosphate aldolase [Spirochaetales bacterium]
MGLQNTKDMLKKASLEGYAIGAFNFTNMEQLQAILETANELNSPVIVAVSSSALNYITPEILMGMINGATKDIKIPVALHLDHGKNFEICKQAIDMGFPSIMIDASYLTFEENVKLTKQIVDYAKKFNVSVEAELGKLAGVEDEVVGANSNYTSPKEAKLFVELTGVDSLAISIGTSHGAYKFEGKPILQLDLLKQIKKAIPNTPLVLHGASSVSNELIESFNKSGGDLKGAKGVSTDLLKKAIRSGIAKVNVDSDLRIAFTTGVRESLKNEELFDLRTYLTEGKKKIKEQVTYKTINIFKSANKG